MRIKRSGYLSDTTAGTVGKRLLHVIQSVSEYVLPISFYIKCRRIVTLPNAVAQYVYHLCGLVLLFRGFVILLPFYDL